MEGLAAEATAAADRARFHKRESARHRREAQAWRAKQAELEAQCRRLGIGLTTNGAGDIHGRNQDRDAQA